MPETSAPAAEPRTVRKARHILDNYYIGPARDADVLEIWAYTDRFSYAPGDTVGLRVSTTADTWDLEVGRDGAMYETMLTETGLNAAHHATPDDCYATGCGWAVAYTFTVGDDWRPGGYLMTLTGHRLTEHGRETVEEHHLIVVRKAGDAKPAPMLLLCATGTWVAYNCWGGANAYDGIAGETGDRFSPVLSLRRPWTRGFCRLPEGAPRTLPDVPSAPGTMTRYPHMEWAYAYGYSKKYASAGWATYERHFARWAEREGYDCDIATLHDLHENPDLLSGYKCAVFVGHDEYWTKEMRDAVDGWVEAGGHAARFAGNFLWQVRLEDADEHGSATQVCYKYVATTDDPLMGTPEQHLLSGAWEEPSVGRPGATTFGVNALRGVYAGFGKCENRAEGFEIFRPDHWAFAGTGLKAGDVLGANSPVGARIYGYEVDSVEYEMRDGLPHPTGEDGADATIEILGIGPATNLEDDEDIWGETLFIGTEDGSWKANALYGEVTPETLERAGRGAGMIVSWRRGKGEVLTIATCEWVTGLTRKDPTVERVTRNVLDRFTT